MSQKEKTIDPDVFINSPIIGFDSETKDPLLKDKGPGCYRKDGYIVGVSFSTEHVQEYYPIDHPDTTPEERERNLNCVRAILASNNAKVGANVIYDADWAQVSGIHINGRLYDIQLAEPLLDEYKYSYSLEALCETYNFRGKEEERINLYAEAQGWGTDTKGNIWRMPSHIVSEYAKDDAYKAFIIHNEQLKKLEAQDLLEIYDIECRNIPLLLQMRKQGVRLDIPLLKKTALSIADKHYELQDKIYELAGQEFNIGSTTQLAKIFDQLKIPYPRNKPTERMKLLGKEGNPNLDKHVLEKLSADFTLAKTILDYRHYDTLISMFFLPYTDFMVDGRLHCQFHPLRSDDYGTVSGRFSSSKPNLQQVPAQEDEDEQNDELSGKIIRRLFIPEEDCEWAKLDYSQVEYRVGAHYAVGPGSDDVRQAYIDDPNTDFHKVIQDATGFDRRQCKRLNFGGAYGMGKETASKSFGWTLDEAEMFMETYHAKAPYIKATRKKVVQSAERRGYIFTLLGRRARVHPTRALHSFYNRLIQGSSADIMKIAMVKAHEAGVFNILHPHLTVHDELDVSVPRTKEGKDALKELNHIMEHATELSVPLIVDCHVGANWADAD